MSTTYVTIDVETTGLNPDKDAIIEVAAITFRDFDILDEFSSLVNPQRDVPAEITALTGITTEMVADAPTLFTLRSRLRSILAEHVVIGHNVNFDLGFFHAERLGVGNRSLDTVTLASILVPDAGRYSLDALARFLDLPDAAAGQNHRALDDAEQTVELFLALRERALKLELDQLEEIVLNGRRLGWPETLFFEEIMSMKTRDAFTGQKRRQRLAPLFTAPRPDGRAIVPEETPHPLDVAAIVGMMQPGGNFDRVFPGFEHRPQQVQMLQAVVTAFNEGQHLLVEAGTGTGKSMAYLLPAAFWAYENGRRVVISTNTINLQDQLILKDIPTLQQALPFTIRAAVRKGRSNYVCTRLFQQLRHNGPRDADEMVLFARILLWLPQTQNGDVAELTIRTPGERLAWQRLNGENAVCTSEHCASENCPLHLARRRAEQAHILIVNHALLLSDVARGGHILPEFTDLIIDEGHHLETAVTDGLSFRADKRFLEAILDEVTKLRSGLLADAQTVVKTAVPQALSEQFDSIAEAIRREGNLAMIRLDEFFETLEYFLQDQVRRNNQFAEQIRLLPAVRAQPGYDEVEISWDNLGKQLKEIAKGLGKLAEAMADLANAHDVTEGEDLRLMLVNHVRSLEEMRLNMQAIISSPTDEMIYWVEVFKDRISLHAAPLHVGPLVEEHIFHQKETVILTSATMRTAGPDTRDEPTFTYLRDRLYASMRKNWPLVRRLIIRTRRCYFGE
ncbi:MAG: exonuclease domain-containing protein [Chloroflexota bacterium]